MRLSSCGSVVLRHFCLVLGLLALCLNAQAKQKELPMPLAEQLPVEVVLDQPELAVDVPNSSAAGVAFGMLGALVASSIHNAQVKTAEERVAPIRDQLIEYRFNERLEAQLRSKLASEGLSPRPSITMMKTRWDAMEAEQNKEAMPPQALMIVPRYSIDHQFKQLSVTLTLLWSERTIKTNGKVKAVYPFVRTYAFHFPMTDSKADQEGAQQWAHMGGARLVELLDQGVVQSVDMLVYDFSAEGRSQWPHKIRRQSVELKGNPYPGVAVRQTPEWLWVRNGGGTLQALHGYQPITAATVSASAAAQAPNVSTESVDAH